ncbi:MAG: replication initiator protein [Microviridae sp.]|nr:MAG: replication initiator protein [Microviridae sp.]
MCLYPKLIKNRKYIANKKNKGIIPEIKDQRVLWVPVGCQKCIECRKQKSRGWSVRLQEEIRTDKTGQFVTLTFSNEAIATLAPEIKGLTGYDLDNEIATLATRKFLENWRSKYKKSVKHWLVTELGHNGTENIHLHGIIFSKEKQEIIKKWKYGFVYIGDYVNEQTVNYITKYITKTDTVHTEYTPIVLTSPGIGGKYTERIDANNNKFKKKDTDETYKTRQGTKLNLPIYYRNKIYTEDEREELWLQKLNKEERWVCGEKVSIKNGDYTEYDKLVKWYRAKNARLKFGDDEINWDKIRYQNERRKLMTEKRIKNEIRATRSETLVGPTARRDGKP